MKMNFDLHENEHVDKSHFLKGLSLVTTERSHLWQGRNELTPEILKYVVVYQGKKRQRDLIH